MNEVRDDGYDDRIACFDCGSLDLVKEWQEQVFQYGSGESAVSLTATMPVHTCKNCGYQFAGPEADDARHDAVCRHLGVLTPQEIVSIREHTGLSRAQFAERTRIGIASLKRWESGVLIQNAANDELIYLMIFSDNVKRLQDRNRFEPLNISGLTASSELPPRHRSTGHFRGRCITADSRLRECADKFALRA